MSKNSESNGGEVLCWIYNGEGKRVLKRSFAGSIAKQTTEFSQTVEYDPKREWSNGSDTRDVESALRRSKKIAGWTEPTGHGGIRRGAGRPKKEPYQEGLPESQGGARYTDRRLMK